MASPLCEFAYDPEDPSSALTSAHRLDMGGHAVPTIRKLLQSHFF